MQQIEERREERGEEEDFPDQNITTRMLDTHPVGAPSENS